MTIQELLDQLETDVTESQRILARRTTLYEQLKAWERDTCPVPSPPLSLDDARRFQERAAHLLDIQSVIPGWLQFGEDFALVTRLAHRLMSETKATVKAAQAAEAIVVEAVKVEEDEEARRLRKAETRERNERLRAEGVATQAFETGRSETVDPEDVIIEKVAGRMGLTVERAKELLRR